jgi:L-threonylcarbamoyladenylate synthase
MKNKFLNWSNPKHIGMVAELLESGRVVLGSSDTVLGLLAKVSGAGVASLNSIKERADKPYIVLIGEKNRIFDFTDTINPEVRALMSTCWPGPLTLIVKACTSVPSYVSQGRDGVAIRVPQHQGLLMLLRMLPALFSTSANIAGAPVARSIDEVDPKIVKHSGTIILDEVGEHREGGHIMPSTIIDCTGSALKIVREGACPLAVIEKILGKRLLPTN